MKTSPKGDYYPWSSGKDLLRRPRKVLIIAGEEQAVLEAFTSVHETAATGDRLRIPFIIPASAVGGMVGTGGREGASGPAPPLSAQQPSAEGPGSSLRLQRTRRRLGDEAQAYAASLSSPSNGLAERHRQLQQELAQYYKAKIAEKDRARAGGYRAKLERGVEIQYFPFVEGEGISRGREAESQRQREEMRDLLRRQREERPPRADALLREASLEHSIAYPLGPGAAAPEEAEAAEAAPGPHLSRHPRVLSRAHEHMSRRLHDAHVRRALEDKVRQTQAELETQSQQRQAEQQQWEEGMLVNDALRYDGHQQRALERRRHAQFLQSQMEERKLRQQQEAEAKRAEAPGYFGPEEKEVQGAELHREHCSDLIRQMEVDQQRRACSRSRRLRQERVLNDNCMAEMSQDRERERQKAVQHREVLTTTWKSQQRIRSASRKVEAS